MYDVRRLPAGAQRAALADLQQRLTETEREAAAEDAAIAEARAAQDAPAKTRTLEEIQAALEGPKGRSLKVVQALLDVETAV
jgi:hypothetical protein